MGENEYEFLNNVYRNAEMGRDGLYFVLRKTDDPAFRKLVETQLMEYQSLMDDTEEQMRAAGKEPRPTAPIAKAMVRMTAQRKAIADNSPSALADMLIQGSSMGVTKVAKEISRFTELSQQSMELAHRLKKTEENNIEQMKQYL